MSVDDGIRDFWAWWQTARHQILHAIEVERSFSDSLVRDISRHVDAIGDLDWELSPGKTARHAFCLSPRGDSQARLITELWRHRGPSPDQTWEYFAARQGVQGFKIVIDEVELDRNDLMVFYEVDTGRERIDATYFHPHFTKLSERRQTTALYLLLDGALGEDGVERWLGHIKATSQKPERSVPFSAFRTALDDLERNATGDRFVLLKGQNEAGEPVFITCNQALKRIDHLLHTMHVAVDLAILDRNPQGLTTPADAERLNQLEDQLSEALGERAVYFGRETKPGHRVMHWYAPEDSAAQPIIERWSAQIPERSPQVEWIRDPTWAFVKRYV
ncbi:MAG TPA: DUF695 domain-containing protein [Kofleriaceae bacterium]